MTKNEGKLDRVIRIIVGVAVLSQAFIGLKSPFAFFGIIFILTGLIGFCPLYKIFGLSTCPLNKALENK